MMRRRTKVRLLDLLTHATTHEVVWPDVCRMQAERE